LGSFSLSSDSLLLRRLDATILTTNYKRDTVKFDANVTGTDHFPIQVNNAGVSLREQSNYITKNKQIERITT